MKLYKKIALVLLSVILAVSAAACDDGNTPVVGGKEELKGNIVLALPLAGQDQQIIQPESKNRIPRDLERRL